MNDPAALRARAGALHLHGLLAHWPEAATSDWVASLLDWEEQERRRRSPPPSQGQALERRLKDARIGRFKPRHAQRAFARRDFDWAWPKRCDRAAHRVKPGGRPPGQARRQATGSSPAAGSRR
jgi:hypothetical protein